MKKILIPIIVFLICFSILWKWTLGFSSFTVFSYTLKDAGQTPREFPDLALMNQDSVVFHLNQEHKYILLNFVYLNCPYVCHKVNNQIEQIYHRFDRETVPPRLGFVTVSFDLTHDGVDKIKKYRNFFGNDISGWDFAIPYQTSQASFDQFLHSVGIWKYTVPSTGIINHAIYMFLINPDNKVVRVFDPATDSNDKILQQINACIKGKPI